MAADSHFLDTNILLTASDQGRSAHAECLETLHQALEGRRTLHASGQIFREYLVVATRPVANNGLGLSPAQAFANVEAFRRCVQLLPETEAVARRLHQFVQRHRLRGKRIQDANVVATLQEHGLRGLLTQNPSDFEAFPDLEIETPSAD